jgi:Cse1
LLLTGSIGCYTYQHGATDILVGLDSIRNFLEALIIPELLDRTNVDAMPLLRSTCIKFVYMFRNQVPDEFVAQFVDLFADYLRATAIVTQSYAAACIDKLLIKPQMQNPRVTVLNE